MEAPGGSCRNEVLKTASPSCVALPFLPESVEWSISAVILPGSNTYTLLRNFENSHVSSYWYLQISLGSNSVKLCIATQYWLNLGVVFSNQIFTYHYFKSQFYSCITLALISTTSCALVYFCSRNVHCRTSILSQSALLFYCLLWHCGCQQNYSNQHRSQKMQILLIYFELISCLCLITSISSRESLHLLLLRSQYIIADQGLRHELMVEVLMISDFKK